MASHRNLAATLQSDRVDCGAGILPAASFHPMPTWKKARYLVSGAGWVGGKILEIWRRAGCPRHGFRYVLLAALFLASLPLATAFELPVGSSQCLVGIAEDWNSSKVTLTLYQKSNSKWQADGASWQGRLGKSGLVWGSGLHPVPAGATTKREGDWRSPAGVFLLGGVWGYQDSIRKNPGLFYRKVTARDLWVEDPASPQYNRNVILDHEPATPWEKKQQMKQDDPAHSLKLFIAHNAPPKVVPGAGSSIFFHIWRGGGSKTTAGCTTMEEAKLRALIAKLDPARRPIYVLLPKAEYVKFQADWKLP